MRGAREGVFGIGVVTDMEVHDISVTCHTVLYARTMPSQSCRASFLSTVRVPRALHFSHGFGGAFIVRPAALASALAFVSAARRASDSSMKAFLLSAFFLAASV